MHYDAHIAEKTPAGSAPPNRRLTVFRASDAIDLQETKAMKVVLHPGAEDGLSKVYAAGLADGYDTRILYRSPDPAGFSLTYVWFKSHYPLLAHTHNTDCLYYIVAGSLLLGSNELFAGDGFFLPAATPYKYTAGPRGVEILEFRGVSEFDIQVKGATPRIWDQMAQICLANRDQWKNEPLPDRKIGSDGVRASVR